MSHPAILGRLAADGSWKGRHVQWMLPGWDLPGLHQAITERTQQGMRTADAMADLWARDIAPVARFDRWHVGIRTPRRGWGRVSSRTGIAEEALYAYALLLAPESEEIVVWRGGACPHHAGTWPRTTGWIGKTPGVDPSARCPHGWKNRVRTLTGFDGKKRTYVAHPAHVVRGCRCYCAGWQTWAYRELYRYPARLSVIGDAIGAAFDRTASTDIDDLAANVLEAGVDVATCWARLVLDGTDAHLAVELARALT